MYEILPSEYQIPGYLPGFGEVIFYFELSCLGRRGVTSCFKVHLATAERDRSFSEMWMAQCRARHITLLRKAFATGLGDFNCWYKAACAEEVLCLQWSVEWRAHISL